MRRWCRIVLAATLLVTTAYAQTPTLAIDADAAAYRRIHLGVEFAPDPAISGFQVWFASERFTSTDAATLHSVVRVAPTNSLRRIPIDEAFDACWTDGQPVHRDAAGNAVVAPGASNWSCQLGGMAQGVTQWLAVVPIGSGGQPLIDPNRLDPVSGRTDVADERTPPPDTRPVVFALSMVIVVATSLLIALRWWDARRGRTRSRLAHYYVAPALIAMATLTFYPILYGIGLAFTDADQSRLGDESWAGISNFITVLGSPGLIRVTLFTFVWAVSNVVFHVAFGLVLALALNRAGLKGRTVYRTILLLPWAIPAYISILAWNGMLQPDGLINAVLGIDTDYFAGVGSARTVVILVNIWLGVPFMMMSISGALQALPKDMFEAADLDGVDRWDQFRYLTLPNLKSTLVPISLLSFIWTFNSFNTIYLLTRGQPYIGFGEPGATDTLITYIFAVAFEYGHYGLAAAWSVLIFILLIGFSWTYLQRTRATEAPA
ncbi:MAG: sugar ABC transporter permease [Pseudomonadota bacterium]